MGAHGILYTKKNILETDYCRLRFSENIVKIIAQKLRSGMSSTVLYRRNTLQHEIYSDLLFVLYCLSKVTLGTLRKGREYGLFPFRDVLVSFRTL